MSLVPPSASIAPWRSTSRPSMQQTWSSAASTSRTLKSARRNNFPGAQISRWFLLSSQRIFLPQSYPGAAYDVRMTEAMVAQLPEQNRHFPWYVLPPLPVYTYSRPHQTSCIRNSAKATAPSARLCEKSIFSSIRANKIKNLQSPYARKTGGYSPENSRLFSYAVESPGSWVTVGEL